MKNKWTGSKCESIGEGTRIIKENQVRKDNQGIKEWQGIDMDIIALKEKIETRENDKQCRD